MCNHSIYLLTTTFTHTGILSEMSGGEFSDFGDSIKKGHAHTIKVVRIIKSQLQTKADYQIIS